MQRWIVGVVLATAASFPAVSSESIDRLEAHVEALASERMGGRLTGSEGERLAAEHVVGTLREIGAVPMPGSGGYLRPFEFTAGIRDTGSELRATGLGRKTVAWSGTDSVRALSFSDDGEVSAGVVFAGYGLSLPEGADPGYDSYAGLDVEGKIVLVLRYFPEDAEGEIRDALARYSGLRYKAMLARDRGAVALLVLTGPRSPNAGKTIESKFDSALSGSGILAASISGRIGERLFRKVAGKTLEEAQKALDDANPHVLGYEIPDVELALDVNIERERGTAHNVIGYLPASSPTEKLPDPLMIGAHFDHLGRGRHANSLAKKNEVGKIHLGADDNASGVAAVLGIARDHAADERRRPLIVAFWSGEELGLLGSSRFVKQRDFETDPIAAYLNFDMVGRVRDNRLTLQAAASSSAWPRLIERSNVPVGFDVQVQDDPWLPTDSTSLYQAGVPTLNFFSGGHEDYHRPSDRAERVNYDDLDRVVSLASLIVRRLDAMDGSPDYVEVQRASKDTAGRDTLRAYTGTIPDYTTEVDGLRLSGVVGGGPADRAGLREGDVIVEFGGRKITNIYDYTFALDAIKVDRPVTVVLLRDGNRLERTITPTSRP